MQKDTKHSQQGRGRMGLSPRKPAASLQECSPSGAIPNVLHSSPKKCDVCEMLPPAPRVFVRGSSHWQPLLGMCQNPTLSEGKQVINTSHIICTDSQHSMPLLPVLEMVETLSKLKFPYTSPRPVFQRRAARPAITVLHRVLLPGGSPGCCSTSITHRATSHDKESLGPDVSSAAVEED